MKPKGTIQYKINKLLLLLAGTCALVSCCREPDSGQSPTPAIKITVGEALFSNYPDERISSLRVIALDPVRQTVVRNVFYPGVNLDHTVILSITTGAYDFIFIANERQGVILPQLDNIFTRDDLTAIALPASAFNSDDDIPMIHTQNGVTVLGDNQGVSIEGAPPVSTWFVTMERLAVRLDIILKSDIDLTSQFTGVAISNLPDFVPLFGEYSGIHTTSRKFFTDNPQDAKYFRDTTIAGVAWAKKIYRVIVPSNVFLPVDTYENIAVLDVLFNDPGAIMSCTLGVDEENDDYTLPRNKYVTVNGLIKFPMEVNIEVADWIPENINGNIGTRFLNVSDIQPQVYDGAVTRVFFWSNQPSVVVENLGFTGTTGSATFPVNAQFDSLSGRDSPHLSYDPVTGTGFIDIASLVNDTGVTTNRIILNANGLRRELPVTVNMTSRLSWSLMHYVGTFHRWNQTGERIINMGHSGAWRAEVVSGDFVILNRNPSPATVAGILGTVNPGNAEDYQVPGNATSVSGNGRIFFRVGLTGAAPSPAVPRYALIRITPSSGIASFLYVRQGEAPAVLNSTLEWTAYNLSDPLRGLGGPNAANHSLFTPRAAVGPTTFADYPTQVGYMFRWNLYDPAQPGSNRAWNARNPLGSSPETGQIAGFPVGMAPVWIGPNDPCPTGYRHPTNAEFVAFASDLSNSAWGFYADGFFDRGTILGNANVTGALNYQYGTFGRVFYNAATNASVFMPVAGNRIGTTGFLQIPFFGTYSSSNLVSVYYGNVLSFFFGSDFLNPSDVGYGTGRAFSVRCVVGADIPMFTLAFSGQGGNPVPGSISATAGTDIIIPLTVPVRPGFTFVSWNTEIDGTGANYSPGNTIRMQNSNITLYAQWNPNPTT